MSIDPLLTWAKAHSVEITNIDFKWTQNQGWGGFPEKVGIPSSIHLPRDAIITPKLAREVLGDRDLSTSILMKALVGYWSKMNDTPFQSYFDILPAARDIHSPLTLSVSELDVYRGTNLNSHSISIKLQQLKKEWSHFQDVILFDDYLYGHLIISSRSFPYKIIDPTAKEDEVMLLPLVDLLNHKPRAHVDWKGQNNGFTIELLSGDDGQLWNNYGPKGNEELLMGYGFVIEDNEFDLLHLTLHLNEEIRSKLERLNIQINNFNDFTTYNQQEGTGEEDNNVVFIINNHHPLPRGLVECFALAAGSDELTLANTLIGIQELKSVLKIKFKGSLDILPKQAENMSTEKYNTSIIYRKGQLKMYNLLMQSIKELERMLLKSNKDKFTKVRDDDNHRGENILYREGKSPLLIDHLCIDSSSWYQPN